MSKEKQIEEMAFNLIMATSPLGVKDLTKQFDYNTVAKDLYELYGWRKQSEWISVEERLPDFNGIVRTWGELRIQPSVRALCACRQKSGKVFVKEGYCELWGSKVVWKIPGTVDSVTHWMPLPEPPKKGGAE